MSALARLQADLSEDRTSAQFTFTGEDGSVARITANGDQLTKLIEGLVAVRCQMPPRIPASPAQADQRSLTLRDPKISCEREPTTGNVLIAAPHPAIGWIWFDLAWEMAFDLRNRLSKALNQKIPTQMKSAPPK